MLVHLCMYDGSRFRMHFRGATNRKPSTNTTPSVTTTITSSHDEIFKSHPPPQGRENAQQLEVEISVLLSDDAGAHGPAQEDATSLTISHCCVRPNRGSTRVEGVHM